MRLSLVVFGSVLAVCGLAASAPPALAQEEPASAGESAESDAAEGADPDFGPEPGEESAADDAGEIDPDDVAPDALHDPLVSKVIKRRVVIERPRFTLETGGKIQVQYFDSDSRDDLKCLWLRWSGRR